MIDIDIINGTIAEWENKPLTFVTVERLAWLYIVRDHNLLDVSPEEEVIKSMPHVAMSSGSEFMEAAYNADINNLWSTLDELMNTIKIIQPRLYEATLTKLRE